MFKYLTLLFFTNNTNVLLLLNVILNTTVNNNSYLCEASLKHYVLLNTLHINLN